jgi:predicted RNase H-like HicB family nuclease
MVEKPGCMTRLSIQRRSGAYPRHLVLRLEIDREVDGRWIYEAIDLPGVISYGKTRDEAKENMALLALRVIDERLEHGEPLPDLDPEETPAEYQHHPA